MSNYKKFVQLSIPPYVKHMVHTTPIDAILYTLIDVYGICLTPDDAMRVLDGTNTIQFAYIQAILKFFGVSISVDDSLAILHGDKSISYVVMECIIRKWKICIDVDTVVRVLNSNIPEDIRFRLFRGEITIDDVFMNVIRNDFYDATSIKLDDANHYDTLRQIILNYKFMGLPLTRMLEQIIPYFNTYYGHLSGWNPSQNSLDYNTSLKILYSAKSNDVSVRECLIRLFEGAGYSLELY